MPLPILPILAATLPAAASVGQGLLASRTQKKNVDKTIKANREMAEYQYSKDLEMWQRGNEYNSPAAQMARLKEAGLNPNLVYGSGSAAGNTAQQLPKYSRPEQKFEYVPSVDLPAVIGMYQDFKIKQAQLDNLKQQNENMKVENLFTQRKSKHELYKGDISRHRALTEATTAELSQYGIDYRKKQIAIATEGMALENEKKQADILYKKYENQWRSQGITSSDNVFIRVLVRMLMESGINPVDFVMPK